MVFGVSVNFVAVFVAAIVSFFIGWIWYGPVFGKTWMRLNKVTQKEIDAAKNKGMAKTMILCFIGSLVTAWVLSVLIGLTGFFGMVAGAKLGLMISLGFVVATAMLGGVLWNDDPWGLFWLNSFYWIINFSVIGAILASW